MILRRVIQHVRKQEWTAIWIDLVIVVVGVFIGIEVANWNDDRATARRGEVFTERLKADLREEAWGYRFLIEYNRDVLANAIHAVEALSGETTATNEALLVSAYRATQYKEGTGRRATYDELISTGTIGLIKDQRLRETTMRIYSSQTIGTLVREGAESGFRRAFRMRISNDLQRALSENCGDRDVAIGDFSGIADSLDYPCKLDLPQQRIDEAALSLRADASLVPLLRLRVADLGTRLHDMTVNNRQILQGLQAVATEAP